MTNSKNGDLAAELRRRAEDFLAKSGSQIVSEDQVAHDLIHELNVHQAELEMQNEALRYTQLQLQSAMEQAHEFFEFAPIGHLTLDRDGAIMKANLTASTMLGQPRTEVFGNRLASMLIPASRTALRAHLEEVFAGPGGRRTCEVSVEPSPARLIHLSVDSVMQIDPVERLPYAVCHLTDVTQRRRAVDELTLGLAMTSDALILLDRELQIVQVSAAAAKRWRIDAVQRPFAEILTPDDVGTVTSKLRSCFNTDNPIELEFRVSGRDSTVTQVTWTVASGASADLLCLVARR